MTSPSVLIANRGEIAIRIARACADLGLRSVAVHPADDARSLHVLRADAAQLLPGRGAAAYLDVAQIVAAAQAAGCSGVHPGYGFLSESDALADACSQAGLAFIGPSADVLRLFGDKARARRAATEQDVPVLAGTPGAVDVAGAQAFFATLNGAGMLVKAIAGGGGRGMRVVQRAGDIAEAHARASAEALSAFGRGEVYCEELIADARHIEIQVLGDGTGEVVHFGERECSLQRRHQKIVEIAPSPTLGNALRERIAEAALAMARAAKYRGLGTFEFLVDRGCADRFVFIEANPRLQVEHTVTEAVYGVDLVQAQIRVALGATLAALGLRQADIPAPRGHAVQLRVNMESMQADGSALPAAGLLTAYELPSGPGVRVDGFGYAGYRTSSNYDALLAKLVVHAPGGYADAVARARRALGETRIQGVATNLGFLAATLAHPEVQANDVSTRWLDAHMAELLASEAAAPVASGFFDSGAAGAVPGAVPGAAAAPAGTVAVVAPMQASVIAIDVREGDAVRAGQQIAVLEAMKMQHVVVAERHGTVRGLATAVGEVLLQGQAIAFVEPGEGEALADAREEQVDLDRIRPDLAESVERHRLTADAARPEAVRKRHAQGGRTARENIDDLVDAGSFTEYGALAFAAQRSRHPVEQLQRSTPADGLIGGLATVNAAEFGPERARTVVVSYDYTVLAGTQGSFNHKKQDRLYKLAADIERPLVLFAEGGGGRPGDTDKALFKVASLDIPTFKAFAHLSGLVPVVGVVHGRCFAGNAALLGCCDVIISTRSANIGMGGPAMIEGGGLGVYTPEQIGPADVQSANGVIDVLVDDEAAATAAARQYLSYFQGTLSAWQCADQRALRRAIPENRLRVYDVRRVIDLLADTGSVLELRRGFGLAMVTALVRIEGRPVGLIANNPMHLGGAIDADAADKAARFIQLCDAHGLPIVSLCDTPGFMVGPEAEKTAQVRRVSRMFVNTASLSVPLVMVVLRKGYGLGALAMAGGDFQDTVFTVSWPTGEFGGMGLEGAVRLAYRKELAAIEDPQAQQAEFERRVAQMYEHGKALSMASVVEIDDVIDPADTRRWIANGLQSAVRERPARSGRRRTHIETW
ncbi:acetyl-CoA carboxylase family protein [Pseudorhodoferax soli]|uniref:acetyl-CoA carboxylase n=1 Tax=Pseudorhodoferax soli TaxID=545864 RepID=A0A368XHX2_9BURK|nr:carboxyl transferase domain-containing protein [Pseudorhodoferax soli]RCW67553.1 biotin-dependent enzyme [Pseudorhodoferax soli]